MNGPQAVTCGILAAAAIAYFALRPSEHQKLVEICEEILAERLVRRGAYSRIGVTPLKSTGADLNELMGWDLPGKKMHDGELRQSDLIVRVAQEAQKLVFSKSDWSRHSTWIEYDTEGLDGAIVRSGSECVMYHRSGEAQKVTPMSDVRVDGLNALDWTMHKLWREQQ